MARWEAGFRHAAIMPPATMLSDGAMITYGCDGGARQSGNRLMPYSFDPDVLLRLPLMANLATMCDDGPRNSPVWFLWEQDALWMPGSAQSGSVRRLLDDPRCAVEIVHFASTQGILLHLGFRGSATVEPLAPPLFERLLEKYLGSQRSDWNPWFVENIAKIDDPTGRMIRLAPDSTFTFNVSYFLTGPELAWSDGMKLPL